MTIGASTETIGIVAGGDAGDWINHELHIPAVEAELGLWRAYDEFWFPKSPEIAFKIVSDNLPWLEHTFEKLGNQLKIEAIGYSKQVNETRGSLLINVTNSGLSDQIHSDIRIRIGN